MTVCGVNQLSRSNRSVTPASFGVLAMPSLTTASAMPLPPARLSRSLIEIGDAVTRTFSSGARVRTIVYVKTASPANPRPVFSKTRSGPLAPVLMTIPAASLSATWAEMPWTKIPL